MSTIGVFAFGFLGTVIVEIGVAAGRYDRHATLPKQYHQRAYWVVKLLLAVAGGVLAVAHGVSTPLLALQVGAATPLMITALRDANRTRSAPRELTP